MTARRTSAAVIAGLVVVGVALVGPVHRSLASSSTSAAARVDPSLSDPDPMVPGHASDRTGPESGPPLEPGHLAMPFGAADGAVPDGVTAFDDQTPAVAKLDPALLRALRRAATDAAGDGVEFSINSGWRSPGYQERLLQEAVAKYGSEREAARWVASPRTSADVAGQAVDLGPSRATAWLSRHGAAYGLCQIYENERWHFELRSTAVDHGCPPEYPDPTHDPRMQR